MSRICETVHYEQCTEHFPHYEQCMEHFPHYEQCREQFPQYEQCREQFPHYEQCTEHFPHYEQCMELNTHCIVYNVRLTRICRTLVAMGWAAVMGECVGRASQGA